MRTLLTPRWIAGHLLAVVAVVTFVSLGFWQLRRLEERRTFNEAVETALAAPAADLDRALADGAGYRRVRIAGLFDPEHEVLVLRSRSGTSGYHVLTPLLFGDGRGVLVDRGWVPIEFDEAPVAEAPPPAGRVTVEGLLWPAEEGGGGSDDLPSVVRRVDPAIVDPHVGVDLVDGRYLLMESPAPGGYPIPAGAPEPTEGPHLSYAGQWFLFASVVTVGYPILLFRVVRGRSGNSASRRSNTSSDRAI